MYCVKNQFSCSAVSLKSHDSGSDWQRPPKALLHCHARIETKHKLVLEMYMSQFVEQHEVCMEGESVSVGEER